MQIPRVREIGVFETCVKETVTCSWIATNRDVDRALPSHVGPLTSYALGGGGATASAWLLVSQ